MNVYRIEHNPAGKWSYVLAESIEKAILLLKRTISREVEIYRVEIVAKEIIMETNRMSILEDRKQIKEFLMEAVPEHIEEWIDNID